MRPGLLVVLVPSIASAADNDFRLYNSDKGRPILFTQTPAGGYEPNDELFRDFVQDLGFVFAPRLASPAETLGHSGFHVGAMWSGSFIPNDRDYWKITERAQSGRSPRGFLQTLQLDVRKGLPFSFEIGVNFMWLIESELFAPGLELRWALQEGYTYVPDFGVRASVNHMVGNRDLLLTTIAIDAVISKSFGLFGMVNLAPYVSWSFIMIAATSRVIDPTPTTEISEQVDGRDVIRSDIENNFVFDEVTAGSELNHKLTIGLRMIYYVLNVSVQGEFQVAGGDGAFGPVSTITTKLGLDF